MVAALVLGGTLLGGAAPAMAAFHSPGDFNRAQVALRANAWVKDRTFYSQTDWFNGYRQDCSGFVSMAWGLKKSYVTWTLPEVAWPIHKSDLSMGDIMLNVDDHVVIFDSWANKQQTAYWEWELAASTGRPVHRVVPYPFWTSDSYKYKPYRFAVARDYTGKKPPAPAPQPSSADASPSVASSASAQPRPAAEAKAPASARRGTPSTHASPATSKRPDFDSAALGDPTAAARGLSRRARARDERPAAQQPFLLVLLKDLVSWLAD